MVSNVAYQNPGPKSSISEVVSKFCVPKKVGPRTSLSCFCWSQFQNFLCVANQIRCFISQFQNFRCAVDQTRNSEILAAAEQNTVLFVAIPKIFATRLNRMQCFWSQFRKFRARLNNMQQQELFLLTNSQNLSLRGRTKYS
jgi:hypothetical protein